MSKRVTIIASFIALIVGLGAVGMYSVSSLAHTPVTDSKTTPQSKYDVGPPEKGELLELVNAERAKYGVAPLVMDDRLNQSAQMKADDMVKYNYFGHVNHDGTRGVSYIGQTAPGLCSIGGENIQLSSNGTSRDAFDSWVASKPHHEAMIDAKNTTTGFGVSYDDYVRQSEVDSSLHYFGGDADNAYLSVEHFCQPL